MTVVTIQEIDTKTLQAITKKLKRHIPKWAHKMSEIISEREDWKNESDKKCTESTVRNIGSGFIESQVYRRIFVLTANDMLNEVSQEHNEVVELAKKIS